MKSIHFSSPFYIMMALIALGFQIWASQYIHENEARFAPNFQMPPSSFEQKLSALGDTEYAFRKYALALQTMGEGHGKTMNFSDLDTEKVSEWLYMLEALNPVSVFPPYIGAYYFAHDKGDLAPITGYLYSYAMKDIGQRWRWLAHASFIAKHKMQDKELAMYYASVLRDNFDGRTMPAWAAGLELVMLSENDTPESKDAARSFILSLLKTEQKNMHPNEIYLLVERLCLELTPEPDRKQLSICNDI